MVQQQNKNKTIEKFLKEFKINPKELNIYIQAFTHSSYSSEHDLNYNYEKLEFLGDAAISWIISNYLFNKEELSEGDKTLTRSNMVNGKNLSKIAKEINLQECLYLGNSFEVTQEIPDKILEDSFEAFIGAVSQDQGIKKVAQIVQSLIIDTFVLEHPKNSNIPLKPYKTIIQEILHRSADNDIFYKKISDNQANLKEVHLIFEEKIMGKGTGKNYKQAEENAAEDAFKKLPEDLKKEFAHH